MGSLVGHVLPGLCFVALALWHLFNHIKLHSSHPISYTSYPWFPTSRFKYIELILIIIATSISISMELFIGPQKHQPLDTDGTIPSNHLRNFEHTLISMTFFTYASIAIILDKVNSKAKGELTQFVGAIAFAQELLLFHLHSTDHVGVEAQYHILIQSVIVVSLVTCLMGIGRLRSFMVSFVRSLSILFQGVWLVIMGYMLYTPSLIPKGCFIYSDDGHKVVRCSGDEAVHRAKALVNILFSWTVIIVTVIGVGFYLVVAKLYGENVEYVALTKMDDMELEMDLKLEQDSDDVESQGEKKHGGPESFVRSENGHAAINIGR